jgi:hypothetical protein
MPMTTATMTTSNLLGHLYRTFGSDLARLIVAAPPEMVPSSDVRISDYTPMLTAANAWLAVVETRIRASIRPDGQEDEESTEWLTRYAADAAITFFRNVADLLPTEPHIAATRSGDLVAEFEAPNCSMTGVVSDHETVLFAVWKHDRSPIHTTIRRGSNRLREEVRTFTDQLGVKSHGNVDTAR